MSTRARLEGAARALLGAERRGFSLWVVRGVPIERCPQCNRNPSVIWPVAASERADAFRLLICDGERHATIVPSERRA